MNEVFGLVENLDRCVGCHSCSIACAKETGEKVIEVREIGPRTIKGELASDFLLTASQDCLCKEFWEKDSDPPCVSVCPTDALAVCDSRELLKKIQSENSRKQVIQIGNEEDHETG